MDRSEKSAFFSNQTNSDNVLGTLAPPLNPSKNNDTIDLIFATHWVYPSSIPVLQPEDEKCLNEQLSKQPG